MRIDLHVHTKHSIDSLIGPKALAAKSRRLGVIPAVADHNSVGAHREMRALGAAFIPAEEIFTDRGDLVGLYVEDLIPRRTPFLEAIDLIHAQGGLAYLPHMFDHGRSKAHAPEKEAARADIVEVFNARCMKKEYNERALAFAERHNLTKGVGSDSHFLFEFGTTYAEVPDFDLSSPKALLKALKSKKARLATRPAPLFVRGTTTFVAIGRKIIRSSGALLRFP